MYKNAVIHVEWIEHSIYLIRGQKVMLDADLAGIYGVPTFRFNEAVKRNRERFPEDFMFRLTCDEVDSLISPNAISKPGRGGRKAISARTSRCAHGNSGISEPCLCCQDE